MLRLLLDTATDYFYIALIKDNEVLKEEYEKGNNNHSETLIPRLELMMKENNLSLKDLDEIYTGIGPGSYTGERISVVIAKMLAIMNNTKVYQFSTLALIASAYDFESYPYIDARRGNAYIAHFLSDENSLTRLKEDSVENINDFFKDSEENKEKMVLMKKPNPIKLINSSEVTLVEDILHLSPNYIQLVEAERKKRGLE